MAATLPDGIEIFKPGRTVDDLGVVRQFSAADVADMAAVYNPALREAPLTIGHPAHNLPAYGMVAGLSVNADGRLAMAPRQVEPQFAEMVRAGRFGKRSAAFYTPEHINNPTPGHWYLRHVAFLGAQPPAIAGLKDIAFADTAEGLVCFSEANPEPTPDPTDKDDTDMSKELQDKLDAAQTLLDKANADLAAANQATKDSAAQLAQFAEAGRKQRHAAHVQFAEAAFNGALLKRPQVAEAVAVLDLVAESAPVQFAEGDATKTVAPVEFIKGLISGGKPLVQFAESMPGNTGAGQAALNNTGKTTLTDAELDTQAKAYAAKHKVQYAEALSAVVSFTA